MAVEYELVGNELDPEFLPSPEDMVCPEECLDPGMMDTLSLNETPVAPLFPGVVAFVTYHELQRHNTFFHPPVCSQCGKKCRSKKDLTAHMDIEHSGNPEEALKHLPKKKFVCPYDGCVRSNLENGFTKKGNVEQHIKSAHKKEKQFVCGEYDLTGNKRVEGWSGEGCGMAICNKSSLIGHIRTQHMGLPAIPGKRRKKPSPDMMDMDDSDSNVRPNRAVAMLTGHGYDELRPFACLMASGGCQGRFGKEYELAYHMELTHEWNVEDINEALENPDTFAPAGGVDEA
jgi:hypothetical protein